MKCERCNKRKVLEFTCKCTKKLCLECLPSYVHECAFDYKENKKEELNKNKVDANFVKVNDI